MVLPNSFVLFLFCLTFAINLIASETECLNEKVANLRGCATQIGKDAVCPKSQRAYHFNSCILAEGEVAIPEIMRLTPNDEIPKNLLLEYPLEKIARNLVLRSYYRQLEESSITIGRVDTWGSVQLQIAFLSSSLESLAVKGFLNQFQTIRSQGTLDRSGRNEAEKIFNGTWIEKQISESTANIHNLRPKYAYAAVFDSQNGYFARNRYESHYGNILAQLKPEVKRRATMSANDSLSVISPWNMNTHMTPIGGPKHTAGKLFYAQNPRYFEAQIYGPLSLADVDFLLVGCYNSREAALTMNAIRDTLDRYSPQTKVYECAVHQAQNAVFFPGDLLYPRPNLQPTPNYSGEFAP